MPSYRDKLAKFVEAEEKAGIDSALLNRLHGLLMEDTMYWNLSPERRNTLNAFFKELHSLLESELMTGKYGASILIDNMIVTSFEAGYRLGQVETEEGK